MTALERAVSATGRTSSGEDSTNQPEWHKIPLHESDQSLDFSIVIVSHNVREFLRQALLSLQKALHSVKAEVFVVDNASNDGTAEMVRSQFPDCILIENHRNLGFARANNLALKKSRGRYLVLLNPDTVVQEDTFAVTKSFMDARADTGMAGCKVLNPDGTLQLACRRSFPTPWVAFTKLAGLSRLFPQSRLFGRYNLTYLPEDEVCEVEAISGSFMVVKREAVEQVGLLDEDFFLYGEDLDWCYRIRSAGWKIHYYPLTQIIHFKGESSRRSGIDSLREFYQAMSLFAHKHFRSRMFFGFYWLLLIAIKARGAVAFMRKVISSLAIPLIDLVLMQINLIVAIWLRFETSEVLHRYIIVDIVYSAVWLICLAMFGCFQRSRFSAYLAAVAAISGFFVNASLTYFFKQYAFSRQVVLIAGVLNTLSFAGWRLGVRILNYLGVLRPADGMANPLGVRTVVVGDFETDQRLVDRLQTHSSHQYDLFGLVSLAKDQVGKTYSGLPVIAALDNLDELLRSPVGQRIQQVIFSTQKISFDRIIGVMSRQRHQRISFKLVPSHLDVIIGKASIDEIAQVPLVEIENRLLATVPRLAKRVFDLVIAILVMVLTAPAYLVARMVNREFEYWDVHIAGDKKIRLRQLQGCGRLGKWGWLKHIVKGDLTWVGKQIARDVRVSETAQDIGLKPGVTGLAQISRKLHLSEEDKHKYDLYYVTHYSPLLDLEILFRAVFRL